MMRSLLGMSGTIILTAAADTIAGDTSTRQAILKGIEAVLTGDHPSFSAEYQTVMPEVPRWFLMRVTQLKESKGVVISQTDISERVRMAQLLEQHILLLAEKRDELEFLTGKLIDAQEQERKRIARDLHDDFNQRLAALSLELESMERAPIALPEPVARQLAGIRGSDRTAFRRLARFRVPAASRPCLSTLAWRLPSRSRRRIHEADQAAREVLRSSGARGRSRRRLPRICFV